MDDSRKTKRELIEELKTLREEFSSLNVREVELKEAKKRLKKTLEGLGADQGRLQSYIEELKITEEELRIQNEEIRAITGELEVSKMKYFNLFDFAPVGYFVFNKDIVILEVNLAGAQMIGRERKYLINKPLIPFIAPEYRDSLTAHFREVKKNVSLLARRDPSDRTGINLPSVEVAFMRKDGVELPAILQSSPLNTSLEGKGSIMTAAVDITERRESEKALREREKLYRQMFMDNDAVMLIIDPESGDIVDANPSASRFYGYGLNELKRFGVSDMSTLTHEEIAVEIKRAETGEKKFFESCQRLSTGEIRNVDVHTGPIDIGGKKMLFAIIYDSSDRKRAEEESKRYAEELEKAVEEVKSFFYIITHDLKTPLINIKGYAKKMSGDINKTKSLDLSMFEKDSREEGEKFLALLEKKLPASLDIIDMSVSHMSDMINAVLMLSRLGRRELYFQEIDMGDIVKSSLMNMAHKIEELDIEITVSDLPVVKADIQSMTMIIKNILNNAVDYLEPTRRGMIEIGGVRGVDETEFYVKDNGIGIEKKDIDRAFQIFRRLGRENVPGEGIGLTYVKTLIERHGGRIWCESEPGVGSIFRFTIPHDPGK
jgi:PAS domain S-box-containing protein